MKFFFSFFAALALTACTSTIDNRGFDFELVKAEQIQKGQTKQDVINILGSPSATSSFKDKAWYYVSRRISTKSFFAPDVQDNKVLAIYFDTSDRVEKVEHVTKDNVINVTPNKEKTETSGYETGVMREVFGNFGRFGTTAPKKGP